MQIIKLMEGDLKGVPEMEFDGKLKDMLPRMSRQARNELFAGLMEQDELKKAQPVRPLQRTACTRGTSGSPMLARHVMQRVAMNCCRKQAPSTTNIVANVAAACRR
jgi:hypothetical protein